jgi:hypothetical protein
MRPLLGITLGCALVAGIAATAVAAAAGTDPSAHAPSTAAVSADPGVKAPKTVGQVLEVVRSRALAQQGDAPAGSTGARAAAIADDPEPTPAPTDEPGPADPVPTEPAPTEPAPTEPAPTEPAPTDPVPSDPAPSDPTPPVDTTAPTGTFVLSSNALWTGQQLTLTQSALADAGNDVATITRVVSWGDGTSTTVSPGATKVIKPYKKKGKFTVSVTLTDAAGNTAKAKISKPAMAVTIPTATFKLSTKAVWHHQSFKVAISKVPSGTTKIILDQGDGTLKSLKVKNPSVTLSYYKKSNKLVPAGAKTLRVTFTNKYGAATPVVAGKVTLKKDSWNPTVKLTKPSKSSASKASAWSTVRGTAADKGSGLQKVQLFVVRANQFGDGWCYTTKKKWLKIDFENEDQDLTACTLASKVTKGKWSHKVSGLKKNYAIALVAFSLDWTDRMSSAAEAQQMLTRN